MDKSESKSLSTIECEAGPSKSNVPNGKKVPLSKKLKSVIDQMAVKSDEENKELPANASLDFNEIFYESDNESETNECLDEAENDEIDEELKTIYGELKAFYEETEFSFFEPSDPFLHKIHSVVERRCLAINGTQPAIDAMAESIQKSRLFSAELKNHLKQIGFTIASAIQCYIWPAIFKGRSVCCVSSPNSGKTAAYLVSLFQSLMKFKGVPRDAIFGPDYVIVCSSFKVVQKVFDEANKLKGSESFPRIIALNSFNEEVQKIPILNGCEILISTPSPLLRLMQNPCGDFKKCCALIFDDCDKCLEIHFSAVKDIFAKYLYLNKNRLSPKEDLRRALFVQTLLFGEKWTKSLEDFYKTQKRGFLLFGNYFEGTVCKNLNNKVSVIEREQDRKVALLDILNEITKTVSMKKFEYDTIAIVCQDRIETTIVSNILKQKAIDSVVLDEGTPHFDHQHLIARWQTGQVILIISDEAISFFPQINMIKSLVHYTVPMISKGSYSARFQLMSLWLRGDINPRNDLVSYNIFINENEGQTLQFYKYLKRCSSTIPPSLKSFKKCVTRQMCQSYVYYGFCPLKKYFCNKRHSLKGKEPIEGLPVDGQIKGRITFVVSPNEFYFIIEEYRNVSSYMWKKFHRVMSLIEMNKKLEKLRDDDVVEVVDNVKVNEVYAIVVREFVHRVKVVKDLGRQPLRGYQETEKEKKGSYLLLFHIDVGYYTRAFSYDLIPLSAELRSVPPFIHKVYLCGLKPLDNEIDWDPKSTQTFFEKVMGKNVQYLTAWVRLQLNGEFWIDSLAAFTKFAQIGIEANYSSPVKSLITSKFAMKNMKKISQFNSNRNEIISKWSCDRQKTIVQYAFLDNFLMEVYLCHFTSFDNFYVRIEKFDEILFLLDNDLSKIENRRCIQHFVVGLICICLHESQVMNRVRIEKINEDNTVVVFFLDHGETSTVLKQNCFVIEDKFITRLPFQAIKCKLVGVEGNVDPNVIYDYTRFPGERYKNLLLEKIIVENEATVVRLYLKRDERDKKIIYDRVSKWLVDNKHAEYSNCDEMNADEFKELMIDVDDPVNDDENIDSNNIDSDDPETRFFDQIFGVSEMKKMLKTLNESNGLKKTSKAQKLRKALKKAKNENESEDNEEQNQPMKFEDLDYNPKSNLQNQAVEPVNSHCDPDAQAMKMNYEQENQPVQFEHFDCIPNSKGVEPLPYDPEDLEDKDEDDDGEILDPGDDCIF